MVTKSTVTALAQITDTTVTKVPRTVTTDSERLRKKLGLGTGSFPG